MTMTERGLFHHALNYAWMNDGLPADDGEVGRILKATVREFRTAWPRVRQCFQEAEGKLRNKRQEEDRADAIEKGRKASASANRRWAQSEGNANALPTQSEGNARASGSGYGSLSGSESEKPKKEVSNFFNEWWDVWSAVRGTAKKIQAVQAWQSVVFDGSGEAAIECTASYLASLDNPAKGFNPDTFIFEQAKDGFQARWPAFSPRTGTPKRETRSERILAAMERDA